MSAHVSALLQNTVLGAGLHRQSVALCTSCLFPPWVFRLQRSDDSSLFQLAHSCSPTPPRPLAAVNISPPHPHLTAACITSCLRRGLQSLPLAEPIICEWYVGGHLLCSGRCLRAALTLTSPTTKTPHNSVPFFSPSSLSLSIFLSCLSLKIHPLLCCV